MTRSLNVTKIFRRTTKEIFHSLTNVWAANHIHFDTALSFIMKHNNCIYFGAVPHFCEQLHSFFGLENQHWSLKPGYFWFNTKQDGKEQKLHFEVESARHRNWSIPNVSAFGSSSHILKVIPQKEIRDHHQSSKMSSPKCPYYFWFFTIST